MILFRSELCSGLISMCYQIGCYLIASNIILIVALLIIPALLFLIILYLGLPLSSFHPILQLSSMPLILLFDNRPLLKRTSLLLSILIKCPSLKQYATIKLLLRSTLILHLPPNIFFYLTLLALRLSFFKSNSVVLSLGILPAW